MGLIYRGSKQISLGDAVGTEGVSTTWLCRRNRDFLQQQCRTAHGPCWTCCGIAVTRMSLPDRWFLRRPSRPPPDLRIKCDCVAFVLESLDHLAGLFGRLI